MRARGRLVAVAAAGAMALGAGTAAAHGGFGGRGPGGPGFGGFGGPFGLGIAACEIPQDQLVTVASSTYLQRIKAYLDDLVADKEITRARADRLLSRVQKQLSLHRILRAASLAPVATALGFASVADLQAALRRKDLDQIADEKKVSETILRDAFRAGRRAVRAKLEELCAIDG
jgi:hypothetical protein